MDPMEPYATEARAYIAAAIAAYGAEGRAELEMPAARADMAYPCFVLARSAGRPPQQIANELAAGYSGTRLKMWAENGYLNMNADSASLAAETVAAIRESGENYGRTFTQSDRVIVEHTSINPNGPIHIGRARNALIGDSLVRCLRQAGMNVESEYYVDDAGRQVTTLVWGAQHLEAPADGGLKADRRFVDYYIRASELAGKDEKCAAGIQEMQRKVDCGDTETIGTVRKVVDEVLGGIRESLESVNVSHDNYAYESDLILSGKVADVIGRLKRLPAAREDGGAWYIPVSGKDVEDRFYFTRADGTSLYPTRDVAYHIDKFSRADRLVDVLGEDQKLSIRFLSVALKLLAEERDVDFLFYSFVTLPEGKMSTRAGSYVLLDDIVEEGKRRAAEEVRKRRTDILEAEVARIASIVGVGALRYNMVRLQAEKRIVFKWEEALNFEGNSAPFVQYAHARACSILEKAGEWSHGSVSYSEEAELALCRQLALFPSILRDVALSMAVHRVAVYTHELASLFNQFYRLVPVLKAPEAAKASRLSLVDATRQVLRISLNCLGIEAPASM